MRDIALALAYRGFSLLIALALLCQPDITYAGNRPWTLARFQHTSWVAKDGAPVAISTLAQTTDGTLWMGSGAGLYSFDGYQFTSVAGASGKTLLSSQVLSLCATHDGGLWIGYESGGISHLVSGVLVNYDANSGYLGSNTHEIAEGKDGTIWASTSTGLMHFSQGSWKRLGPESGLKIERTLGALVTNDGTVWTTQDGKLLSLKAGSSMFIDMGIQLTKRVFNIELAPGGIMIGLVNGPVIRYAEHNGALVEVANPVLPFFGTPLFDRRGSLWIAGPGAGLLHFADPNAWYSDSHGTLDQTAQTYKRTDGLTSDYAWPILQDAEGDIWIGTAEGLDRFRAADFALATTPSGAHDFALAPAEGGKLWAGTSTHPVMLLDGSTVELTQVPPFTLAVYHDPRDGTVWAGSSSGVWKLGPSGNTLFAPLPHESADAYPYLLARDQHSTLWMGLWSQHARMLYSYTNGQWVLHPDQKSPTALTTTRSGQLWIGYEDNRIEEFVDQDHHLLTASNGVNVGAVHALEDHMDAMWVGGTNGLGYIKSGQFHKVSLDSSQSLTDITAVLFAHDGSLWIHTLKGIFRISSDTVRKVEDRPDFPMTYRLFGVSDGVVGLAGQIEPLPSGTVGSGGRLWFSTSSGVLWVDPTQLVSEGPPPAVKISTVTIDGKSIGASNAMHLPALSRNIRFSFNAATLAHPEDMSYRIRLEPFDQSWQEIGTTRAITYATLRPGRYTFRVQTREGDDSWIEPGSSLAFRVAPAFYQAYWFYALCLLCVAAFIFFAHWLNVRRMVKLSQSRFNERIWERERIARELHDSLLQDMHALTMHLQLYESREGNFAITQSYLASANELARNALNSARNSVKHLREHEQGPEHDLVLSLIDAIEHFKRYYPVAIHFSKSGKERRLQSTSCEEVFAIAKEAILNALKHADATVVDVQISFARRFFVLSVRDNGKGIDTASLNQRQAEGHWGLKGMQERANALGGCLKIEPDISGGTEVSLRLPGATIYAPD